MKLSIVVPAHNEEANIPPLFKSLKTLLDGRCDHWHVLFVDDGSTDGSFTLLQGLSQTSPQIGYLSLSRNFGQQAALTAGLDHADGDVVVTMDADLQHPPELILDMLQKWKNGADIVNTVRISTQDASWIKTWSSRFFYRIFSWLGESHLQYGTADFRLMDRAVVAQLKNMPERTRFLRGMIGWLGFRTEFLEYIAAPRLHGKSHYSLRKMMRFAWTAIRSFSARPLRIATWMGLIASLSGLLCLIYVLYVRCVSGSTAPGGSSLISAVLILGGLQLFCTGLLGEYLALAFEEMKHRPLYVVRSAGNIPSYISSSHRPAT